MCGERKGSDRWIGVTRGGRSRRRASNVSLLATPAAKSAKAFDSRGMYSKLSLLKEEVSLFFCKEDRVSRNNVCTFGRIVLKLHNGEVVKLENNLEALDRVLFSPTVVDCKEGVSCH